ncbi:hypothetical protein HMPREF9104_00001 [Lentilactobacillus kisonensis F0435]|uniref:Uncharacterized protein n=1 Tax=Lentilactobacillus kisonensis F0435 TaxID=797516 RepID=H1LBP1_9LACO|nr:hypothetical protein HMPREF9104_00001 [Lentilactobacillus kisonensis F0435]
MLMGKELPEPTEAELIVAKLESTRKNYLIWLVLKKAIALDDKIRGDCFLCNYCLSSGKLAEFVLVSSPVLKQIKDIIIPVKGSKGALTHHTKMWCLFYKLS